MKKILVVDDSKFMRTMIKNILKNNDYEFVEAEDGQVAIDCYLKEKPDIVLMDITMPGMSGLEALKKIRAVDMDAQVIMCSAVGQESIIHEAILEGAIDFIVKPFKEDVLKRTVCATAYRENRGE